jgi:hypothetical protein
MTDIDLNEFIADLDAYQAAHPWRRRFRRVWFTVKHAPGNARNQIRWAWQRVHRGWDDRALWSLDTWLAGTLGAQLIAMADLAHGWPGMADWTFETWTAALRQHGGVLSDYGHNCDADDAAIDSAQESMRWVADHLPNLWD